MEYYYFDGQRQQGPFSLEALRNRALKPETLVWHEGLRDWTMAIAIPELIDLFLDLSASPALSKTASAGAPPPVKGGSPAKVPVRPFPGKRHVGMPKGVILLIIAIVIAGATLIGWGVYRSRQSRHTDINGNSESDTATIAEQRRQEQEQQRLRLEEERKQARLRAMRNNWSRYFRLEQNDYEVLPILGGILPFDVTVTNNSDYPVDKLNVRITYVKADGKAYKTETLGFSNIPAHASRTGDAPGSRRGVTILRRITYIRCGKLNFCYPGGAGGKTGDPYYCD